MHVTQPAVTQAVASLEKAVGGRLFERHPHGVDATPVGNRVAVRLERALEQVALGLIEAGAPLGSRGALSRSVTTTQLRAVAEVVSAGGIAAAARSVGTTRATLHRPVRELESVLDVVLLESTSHGIRPTRAAERLARRIRLAESEWLQACAEVAEHEGEERGATVIGAMPLARSVIVPAAVLAFAEQFPSHRVGVLDGPYESMLEALQQGRADWLVGALRDYAPNDVIQTILFEDPLAIVGRIGHPLVGHHAISAKALKAQAWIAPRPASPLRRQFDLLIGAGGPVAPIECNSLVAARSFLLASDRLMLSSTHQVRHELNSGLLSTVSHPFGALTRTIGITQRRDWEPTPTQSVLLKLLRLEAGKAAQDSKSVVDVGQAWRRKRRGEVPIPREKTREK